MRWRCASRATLGVYGLFTLAGVLFGVSPSDLRIANPDRLTVEVKLPTVTCVSSFSFR